MKCIPITRSAREVFAPILVIEIDDVFEAKIVSGGQTLSSFCSSAILASSFSITASITKSTLARSSRLVVVSTPAHHAIALFGLEAAALDHAIEVARDRIDAALAHIRRDIMHHDRDLRLRRDLRDSRAHLPCPDHADLLQTHSSLRKILSPN